MDVAKSLVLLFSSIRPGEKFLNSCGTDIGNKREVLRLFSGILSGYCAQVLVPVFYKIYLIELQNRAPVLVLNPSDTRFNVTFDFISKTIKALTVSTHTRDKLRSKCPPFLPQGIGQKSLDEGSFLWYKKNLISAEDALAKTSRPDELRRLINM